MKEDKKNKEKTISNTLNPQELIDPVSKLVVFNYEEIPITEIVNAIIIGACNAAIHDNNKLSNING